MPSLTPALWSNHQAMRSPIKCLLQGVSAVKLNVPDVPKKDEPPEVKSTTRQHSGMLAASWCWKAWL